jgi:hypothetical protein
MLLAIDGTRPDPAYPPDGEDLAPARTGAAPHSRKFYWRYKAGSQRAIRDADWKCPRIAGNELLFDVAQDPCERPRPATYGNPGNLVADHYGVVNPAPATPPESAAQR